MKTKSIKTSVKWSKEDLLWLNQHRNDPRHLIYAKFPDRTKNAIQYQLSSLKNKKIANVQVPVKNNHVATTNDKVQVYAGTNKVNVDLKRNSITIESGSTLLTLNW